MFDGGLGCYCVDLGWVNICLFLTALFHPRFMINVMTDFDIHVVNFPFLDSDVEYVVMLMTLILVINA